MQLFGFGDIGPIHNPNELLVISKVVRNFALTGSKISQSLCSFEMTRKRMQANTGAERG
jgi:hypothetical protein